MEKMDNEVDIVENGAVVKVFLLEAPLPWNAGDEILSAAGPFWEGYGEIAQKNHLKLIKEKLHSSRYCVALFHEPARCFEST